MLITNAFPTIKHIELLYVVQGLMCDSHIFEIYNYFNYTIFYMQKVLEINDTIVFHFILYNQLL